MWSLPPSQWLDGGQRKVELDQCGVSAYHLQVRGGLNLLPVDRAEFLFQF